MVCSEVLSPEPTLLFLLGLGISVHPLFQGLGLTHIENLLFSRQHMIHDRRQRQVFHIVFNAIYTAFRDMSMVVVILRILKGVLEENPNAIQALKVSRVIK